jgi:hypothetical protein
MVFAAPIRRQHVTHLQRVVRGLMRRWLPLGRLACRLRVTPNHLVHEA